MVDRPVLPVRAGADAVNGPLLPGRWTLSEEVLELSWQGSIRDGSLLLAACQQCLLTVSQSAQGLVWAGPCCLQWAVNRSLMILCCGTCADALLRLCPPAAPLRPVYVHVCFPGLQVPVIQVMLGQLGIVSSEQMFSLWRYVVVGATVAAAVLTPSTDPFTQALLAIPLVGLYMGGAFMVKVLEQRKVAGAEA